ncbi:MAG: hypothetical protein HW387_980 [Parachlamydiales bacterium]|nr:hypothetical protein [Parachlamydiales bacterium]
MEKKNPNNYFVCDLGRNFKLLKSCEVVLFDVIMSWECFEHIKTDDVDVLLRNIKNHSKTDTIYYFCIGFTECPVHRTVKSRKWWLDKFKQFGLQEKPFNLSQHELIRNLPNLSHYFCMDNFSETEKQI